MRTEAGTSSDLVSPTSGCRRSPSAISSAHFCMYSCARCTGLRVWKATTLRHDSEGNGHGPGHAARKSHVGSHRAVVRFAQKTFERRISARGDHLQIGNLSPAQVKGGHLRRGLDESLAFKAGHFTVNECAP